MKIQSSFKAISYWLYILTLGFCLGCEGSDSQQNLALCTSPACPINVSVYDGYVSVFSQELVLNPYDDDYPYKISELNWHMKYFPVLGAKVATHLLSNTFHLSLDGWTRLNTGKGEMTDRDYYDVSRPWRATDISWHKDTRMKSAYFFDFEAAFDLIIASQSNVVMKLGALCGYRFVKLHWESYGGYFSYNKGTNYGKSDPNELGIAYKERFYIPYFGLRFDGSWNDDVTLSIFGKYTDQAMARNRDNHAVRNIVFYDEFDEATYWVAGAELRYAIGEKLYFDLKYSYERLNYAVGDTFVIVNNKQFRGKKIAGILHAQQLIAFGVTTKF